MSLAKTWVGEPTQWHLMSWVCAVKGEISYVDLVRKGVKVRSSTNQRYGTVQSVEVLTIGRRKKDFATVCWSDGKIEEGVEIGEKLQVAAIEKRLLPAACSSGIPKSSKKQSTDESSKEEQEVPTDDPPLPLPFSNPGNNAVEEHEQKHFDGCQERDREQEHDRVRGHVQEQERAEESSKEEQEVPTDDSSPPLPFSNQGNSAVHFDGCQEQEHDRAQGHIQEQERAEESSKEEQEVPTDDSSPPLPFSNPGNNAVEEHEQKRFDSCQEYDREQEHDRAREHVQEQERAEESSKEEQEVPTDDSSPPLPFSNPGNNAVEEQEQKHFDGCQERDREQEHDRAQGHVQEQERAEESSKEEQEVPTDDSSPPLVLLDQDQDNDQYQDQEIVKPLIEKVSQISTKARGNTCISERDLHLMTTGRCDLCAEDLFTSNGDLPYCGCRDGRLRALVIGMTNSPTVTIPNNGTTGQEFRDTVRLRTFAATTNYIVRTNNINHASQQGFHCDFDMIHKDWIDKLKHYLGSNPYSRIYFDFINMPCSYATDTLRLHSSLRGGGFVRNLVSIFIK